MGCFAVQLNIKMVVPGISLGVVHLYHAHTALNQARGGQTSTSSTSFAIEFLYSITLFAHIKDVWSLRLHSVSGLHGFDSGLQLRIVGRHGRHIHSVEFRNQIKLLFLLRQIEQLVMDIRNQLLGIEILRAGIVGNVSSLESRR